MVKPQKNKFYKYGFWILIVLSIGLIVALILNVSKTNSNNRNLCTTPRCTSSAATIIKHMNLSKDPCKDFYNFVCDGYSRHNHIPNNLISINIYSDGERKIAERLQDLLVEKSKTGEPKAVTKAKTAYAACMNSSLNRQVQVQSLRDLITYLNGWNLFGIESNGHSNETSLEDLIVNLKKVNLLKDIVGIALLPDSIQTDINRITFYHPELPFQWSSSSEFSKPDTSTSCETEYTHQLGLFQNMSRSLGINNTCFDKDEIKDFFLLKEKSEKFANKYLVPVSESIYSEVFYNKMTIKEFTKLTNNSVDWLLVLQKLFEGFANITENEEIVVAELLYYQHFAQLLSDFKEEVIKKYLVWKGLMSVQQRANLDIFLRKQIASQQNTPEECFREVQKMYSFALARMYVDDQISKSTMKSVDELIATVRKTYRQIIKQSSWLDESTKNVALLKIDGMQRLAGYPQWIANDEKLKYHYNNYHPSIDNHFANIIDSNRNDIRSRIRAYRQPVDRKGWRLVPIGIRALYDGNLNALYLSN